MKRLYKVGLSTRVESSDEESLGEEDASKHGRNIADIDVDKEITLVDETAEDQKRFDDQEMFDTWVLDNEKVVVKKAVADKEVSAVEEVNADSITTPISVAATTTTAATTPTIFMDEITLAKALIEIKTSRPNAKGMVMQEPSETPTPTPIVYSQQPSKVHDKDERLAREKNKVNNAVIEQWNDVQAKIEANYELAQKLDSLRGISKRSGDEMEQKIAKKQRIEDENESAELKRCLEIVPDDEDDVTIDVTPLSFKSPTNNTLYYLLVKKMYPFTHHTLYQMFSDVKLQVDYECEMAYELLRLARKHFREGYVAE
uniref:Uncharacterized protein n=1 Tax=Tanacetum cinerariifolium TaxID=118510 RepID=A0A699IMP9_TANCI|nr:hypothetical protein [Tanacetum cinerariifolium]